MSAIGGDRHWFGHRTWAVIRKRATAPLAAGGYRERRVGRSELWGYAYPARPRTGIGFSRHRQPCSGRLPDDPAPPPPIALA